MPNSSDTTHASWEYLMPKRKERMLGYIRESDITLADSVTIDSAAKAVRQYGEKTGYIYEPIHEFREAISAYEVAYMDRKVLQEALAACKRGEVDVFVVTEIRALGRRQVEIFVLYDILQKYNVRLETISGRFEDNAIGRHILATHALVAELERENTYQRLQRGKRDRIEIGNAPVNGQRCYGYILVDSPRETHALYEFNHEVVFVDDDGKEWSEYTVVHYILDLLRERMSYRAIAIKLNDIGIPPPKKAKKKLQPIWNARAISRMLEIPTYTGKVYANRYKRIGKNLVRRPKEEWILIPILAPAYITEEELIEMKRYASHNQQDSLRNNKHPDELGLLRGGYIFCGICGKRMHIVNPSLSSLKNHGGPLYRCETPYGKSHGTVNYHRTQIHTKLIDDLAKEKIREVLCHPEQVRTQVMAWRAENRETFDPTDIEATIEKIGKALQNLYRLAENAPDDEELARITHRMQELGKQKREAESMIFSLEEDKEEREELEIELLRFERWVEKVKPFLANPLYEPNYEELRLAIHILGLRATVYPTKGEWPYRHFIEAKVPEVMKKAAIMGQSRT